MARNAISLDDGPAATFNSPVLIPVPGKKPIPVNFTYKYRDADEYEEFVSQLPGRDIVDVVMDIASGWDLEEPFSRDNVTRLNTKYNGSGMAVFDVYVKENTGARRGN